LTTDPIASYKLLQHTASVIKLKKKKKNSERHKHCLLFLAGAKWNTVWHYDLWFFSM